MPQTILDSHIHLWPQSAANPTSHGWMQTGAQLTKQYSINDYVGVTVSRLDKYKVHGFIYVETDRAIAQNIDGDVKKWAAEPLKEIAFLQRVVEGTPEGDEGFNGSQSNLIQGIVAWAPLDRPTHDFLQYMAAAKEVAGERTWNKIKGFRYLLQGIRDKTEFRRLLDPDVSSFVGHLQLLGRQGLSFDVGVDQRQSGVWQLELFAECIERVHQSVQSTEKTVFILNHLCKPDMEHTSNHNEHRSQNFERWKSAISRMARQDKVYMKLSGAFSEIMDQSPENVMAIGDVVERMKPWLDHVFEEFGCSRIMFGSDWPVCNVRGPGDAKSWGHWVEVVDQIMRSRDLSEVEMNRVWYGTASEAYKVDVKH